MAVNSEKLKISIRETITLNNNKYDSFINHTVTGINEINKRIVTLPTTVQDIVNVSGSIGPGTVLTDNVKYMRFTNLQDSNEPASVNLIFRNTNSDEFAVKLEYGHSYLYTGTYKSGVSESMDAVDNDTLATGVSMGHLQKVTAYSNGWPVSASAGVTEADATATADIEIFIAST